MNQNSGKRSPVCQLINIQAKGEEELPGSATQVSGCLVLDSKKNNILKVSISFQF